MRSCKHVILSYVAAALAFILAACSTTRRIPDGEVLYTGVKNVDINTPAGQSMPDGVIESLNEAVAVKPNNALFGSAKYRTGFPLGLWVYNNWPNPESGLKHWLFEKLSAEPVLVSDVRPELRTRMMDEILDNNGYFQGSVNYELVKGSNPKKAKILYKVNAGTAYTLDSIALLPDSCELNHMIDSIAGKVKYLNPGQRFSTDSLAMARTAIANGLRNRGYYFFRPEYIEYLADSSITPDRVALKMTLASNAPEFALQRYKTGNVTTYIMRNQGGGTPDTVQTSRGTLIQMMPSRFRRALIDECVTFREGRYFSVRNMDRTQNYLSRLGIFSGINIEVMPDTAWNKRLLNVAITCTMDKPLEASLEVNASSKSNSYIGPGLTFNVTNHNIFGGGEQLNIGVTGSYEWQTGHEKNRSLFNSYEAGINASLAFPRLIAPDFFKRRRRAQNWTRIALGADLLNRPHYFKMAQFNASFNWDWVATRYTSMTLTPFKVTYTKLIKTTPEFDSIMSKNPAVALSFQSQFIPRLAYNFNFDRMFTPSNGLTWNFSVEEAGNIFWGIWQACGKKGEKTLFDTPFSQFVKGQTQLVWNHRLSGDHWVVTRAAVGAEHAYGNSTEVPYADQFYCGGANSVRAFTVRSIGPGSYHAASAIDNGYFDQTGTFKFEFNVEYRFPLVGPLHGAMFLDSGNVWLLKDDPSRPGGMLQAHTFFKDLAVGTGVGLRFDISMMVIRGDLGVGIHAPYDTGKSGYYNMTSFKKSLAFHLAIGYPF